MPKKLRRAPRSLPEPLKSVVDYRKSGLSLNHIVGCPLDCAYCVRHLFDNYEMKRPHRILSTQEAVKALTSHWAFQRDLTPVQIFNRATDPFLPNVKDELFAVLEALDAMKLLNPVLVITRWKVTKEDVERLEFLKNLKLTILVTWSGIDDARLEPVDHSIAAHSLKILSEYAIRTRKILYWRPLIAGINDSADHIAEAARLAQLADATAFTGLFLRAQIQNYLRSLGLDDLYEETARRKILPRQLEAQILESFKSSTIFRKTSCAVAHAWGIADYNGHVGRRDICDICPKSQKDICSHAHRMPNIADIESLAKVAGLDMADIEIDGERVLVSGSREEQRYFIQHALGYQVHDRAHPHLPGRHGRADIGWL